MRKLVIISYILLNICILYANPAQIQILQDEVGKQIRKKNYKEAVCIQKKILQLAENKKDQKELATQSQNLGILYAVHIQDPIKAKQYFTKALTIALPTKDKKLISKCYDSLGLINFSLNNFDTALLYHFRALRVRELIKDSTGIATSYNNIAIIYQKLRKTREALSYQSKALQLMNEKNNPQGKANALNNMGNLYLDYNQSDKAYQFYLQALTIMTKIKDLTGLNNVYANMGVVYYNKKEYKTAIFYFHKSLQVAENINNSYSIINSYNNLSNCYNELGDKRTALHFLLQAEEKLKEYPSKELQMLNYQGLASWYEKNGNSSFALRYYKRYTVVKDSLYNIEKAKAIDEIQTKYETEKKEQQNLLLQKDLKVNLLKLENQKAVKAKLSLIIILCVISLFMLIYLLLLKSSSNKILQAKIKDALRKHEEQQQIIVHQAGLTAIGEMATGIAHEIAQPLQNLTFNNEEIEYQLAQEPIDKKSIKKQTTEINANIKRINETIEHVRLFAGGQKSNKDELFNINNVVLSALQMVDKKRKKNNINCVLTLTQQELNIRGNPYKLEQVLINFLSNAIDAIVQKQETVGTITIETTQDNDLFLLKIEDNGIGIDKTNRTNIFLPFFTTKEFGRGLGLGLSISYGIIQELKGRIEVDSELNVGTLFKIYLPFIQEDKNNDKHTHS